MSETELQKIPTKWWVYCNRCGGDTHHECIWKSSRSEVDMDEEEGYPNYVEEWISVGWRCFGCESVSLEEKFTMSGMTDSSGESIWSSTFYPSRKKYEIKPKHFFLISKKLAGVYKESVIAFNVNARVLCAAGLRALIEGICVDKKIQGANLEKKIDKLESILPTNIVKNLHALRFMGNTAAHELDPPKAQSLRLAIDICHDLLNYLYELDYKATNLGKITLPLSETKSAIKKSR